MLQWGAHCWDASPASCCQYKKVGVAQAGSFNVSFHTRRLFYEVVVEIGELLAAPGRAWRRRHCSRPSVLLPTSIFPSPTSLRDSMGVLQLAAAAVALLASFGDAAPSSPVSTIDKRALKFDFNGEKVRGVNLGGWFGAFCLGSSSVQPTLPINELTHHSPGAMDNSIHLRGCSCCCCGR